MMESKKYSKKNEETDNFNYLSKSIHVDNDVSHLLSSVEALRKENTNNCGNSKALSTDLHVYNIQTCKLPFFSLLLKTPLGIKCCKLKEEEPLINRIKTKIQMKMREKQHRELQTVNRCGFWRMHHARV